MQPQGKEPTSSLVGRLPLQNALVDMSLSMEKLPSLVYHGMLAGLRHSSCSKEVLSNICVLSQNIADLLLCHCMTPYTITVALHISAR